MNDKRKNNIMPIKYIINQTHTTLFWKDGTKTIVKKKDEDEFDRKLGFLIAYFQKNSGLSKTQANKYLENLMTEEEMNFKKVFDNLNDVMGNICLGISNAFKDMANTLKNLQERTINIKDIKIPKYFKKPNEKKMKRKIEYFRRNNCVQSPIVLDENNVLKDGYTSYLIFKNYTIMDKVIVVREVKQK